MALWKWFLGVVFLAVVVSDEVPQELNPQEHIIPISFSHSDLMRIFPNQTEKLRELVEKLQYADKKQQIAILNDYTDDVLRNLNGFIIDQSMDPVPMPDIVEEFEWKILLIKYYGIMSLTNGWLQGMGSLERRGDVLCKYADKTINVYAPLGINKLLFNYDYKAQFMGLGPTGGVDGSVAGCKFTFDLNIDMVHLRAEIDKFKLDTLGKIKLKFTGNVLVDWMVNIFVSVTIPMVQPIIRLVIQGFCTSLFNGICDVFNSVMCRLLDNCLTEAASILL